MAHLRHRRGGGPDEGVEGHREGPLLLLHGGAEVPEGLRPGLLLAKLAGLERMARNPTESHESSVTVSMKAGTDKQERNIVVLVRLNLIGIR